MTRLSIGVAVVVAVGAANVAFAQSNCDSTITRAAGKKVACKAGVISKAQKSGGPPDAARLAKCEAKFANACGNGRAAGDCVVQLGSCASVEATVDACVATLMASTVPTTTTTTIVPVCGNGVVEPPEACDGATCPPQPYPFYPDGCNDACQCCARDSACYVRGFGVQGFLRIPCCSGLRCLEPPMEFGPNATGACYRSCAQPADCSPPYVCSPAGVCLQPCVQDSDCVPPEFFCYQGVCLR